MNPIRRRNPSSVMFPVGLILLLTQAAFGQAHVQAGAQIARFVSERFPEWKIEWQGQAFRPVSAVPEILEGRWADGARGLTIMIEQAGSREDLRQRHQLFQTRSMMPPNREVPGVGDQSRLFEHSDRVEVGFTSARDLLYIIVTVLFPAERRELLGPAPRVEVDKAIVFARGLAAIIGAAGAEQYAANLPVAFSARPVQPGRDIPLEARGAGVRPDPASPRDETSAIAFGIVSDPGDHGPLSLHINGKVAALEVTWVDPAVFRNAADAATFLRRWLGVFSGTSHTFVVWSQGLDFPAITASVQHVTGKQGRLLIWRSGDAAALYAYLDGDGKWWFGGWQNVSF